MYMDSIALEDSIPYRTQTDVYPTEREPFSDRTTADNIKKTQTGPTAKSTPQRPSTTELLPPPPTTASPEGGSTGSGRRPARQRDEESSSTALIDRLSRALGDATDGSVRALQTLAERSVVLGREGEAWLRTR